jgi:hypothetical protein
MNGLTAVESEIESLNNVILAAEAWSKQYRKDPETHAKLIKTESRLETTLRRYFKELSDRVPSYINWYMYEHLKSQVAAAAGDDLKIDVFISDDVFGKEDGLFVQTVFDPLSQAIALGAAAGEKVYSQDIGISQTSAVVQRTAQEMTAELVGKKLDASGQMIDNPKAAFRISDKTRADIRQSIATSLSLGEDQKSATERLQASIKNPKRAGTIARTEAVNGYQKGLLSMGQESGAVGKEWQSTNNDDICGTNAAAGVIKLDRNFPSGHSAPAAHPNCRCSIRLVYPEDPSAANLNSTNLDIPSDDLVTGYHGTGNNLANGNYALGDAFYVTRSESTAAKFGEVKAYDLNINKSDILLIGDNDQYTELVAEALRKYPGENFNAAFPKFVASKGYKAVEMSPDLDDLGGIAILDKKLITKATAAPDLSKTDLATIVRQSNTRPAAEINTKIEDLLNSAHSPKNLKLAIAEAQKLPEEDARAMLGAITYNGKSVSQLYFTVRFDPNTKKIQSVLKDPNKNPLKMTSDQIVTDITAL